MCRLLICTHRLIFMYRLVICMCRLHNLNLQISNLFFYKYLFVFKCLASISWISILLKVQVSYLCPNSHTLVGTCNVCLSKRHIWHLKDVHAQVFHTYRLLVCMYKLRLHSYGWGILNVWAKYFVLMNC